MFDTAQPYIAAYALFKKDGKYAFVLRENTSWMNHHYGFPSGKVEKNESFTAATVREAKEEVGIDLTPDSLKQVLTVHRHSDGMDWIDVLFEVSAWDGDLVNAEPHMHSELAWLDPHNLPENMIPYVQPYLAAIESGQHYLELYWDGEKDPSE